ncbi:hypothetical protein ACGYQ5_14250 [Burkholderia pseudomallei]
MDNQHRKITGYRELDEHEIALVNKIKATGNDLAEIIDAMMGDAQYDQRCVAIARTEMQTACMWLIRAVTKPTTFC